MPLLESDPWLFTTHGRVLAMAGNTPAAARNVPKYLGATAVHVASKTYPMPATQLSMAIMRPRCCSRSAIQHVATVTMVETKYGGADKPCAVIEENPISFRIVGRNTGNEAYDTLHEKYMSCRFRQSTPKS